MNKSTHFMSPFPVSKTLWRIGALSYGVLTFSHSVSAKNYVIDEVATISPADYNYNGWPTVTRRANGELWVVWSSGRESHVCPFGRVESMVSRDELGPNLVPSACWDTLRISFGLATIHSF